MQLLSYLSGVTSDTDPIDLAMARSSREMITHEVKRGLAEAVLRTP